MWFSHDETWLKWTCRMRAEANITFPLKAYQFWVYWIHNLQTWWDWTHLHLTILIWCDTAIMTFFDAAKRFSWRCTKRQISISVCDFMRVGSLGLFCTRVGCSRVNNMLVCWLASREYSIIILLHPEQNKENRSLSFCDNFLSFNPHIDTSYVPNAFHNRIWGQRIDLFPGLFCFSGHYDFGFRIRIGGQN
jgi:hypothetical protein